MRPIQVIFISMMVLIGLLYADADWENVNIDWVNFKT